MLDTTINTAMQPSTRTIKHALVYALLLSSALAIFVWRELPQYPHSEEDNQWYIALASGNNEIVPKPFSNRILLPIVVRCLAKTGVSIKISFFAISGVSMAIWLFCVFQLLARVTRFYWFAPVLYCIPYIFETARNYILPELFYSSLLGLFFLALAHDRRREALALLFFLQLTRESTALLTLWIFILGCLYQQRRFAFAALCITLIASFIPWLILHNTRGNIHEINGIMYIILKLPYNAAKNIFGIILWSDTLSLKTDHFHNNPIWTMDIPRWLPMGNIHKIGVCGFHPAIALSTITIYASIFGIWTCAAACLLKYKSKHLLKKSPFWLIIALAYGVCAYVIGPIEGASVTRLVGYGWPAFLLAVPMLVLSLRTLAQRHLIQLSAYHLILSWSPSVLAFTGISQIIRQMIGLLLVIILYKKSVDLLKAHTCEMGNESKI